MQVDKEEKVFCLPECIPVEPIGDVAIAHIGIWWN